MIATHVCKGGASFLRKIKLFTHVRVTDCIIRVDSLMYSFAVVLLKSTEILLGYQFIPRPAPAPPQL